MSESDLKPHVLMLATRLGARLFRSNTGEGWVGKIVGRAGNRLTLENPRVLHAGLVKGGSDFLGWSPYTVTADDVGRTLAVFTAVETKGSGGATPEQKRFIAAVLAFGGRAGVARTIDEVESILTATPGIPEQDRTERK